jgi:acetyl esterase/lipase
VGLLGRQLVTAALTANALRPAPGFRAGIPAFVAGMMTNELAPQLLTLTALDAAGHLARGRRSRLGLALAAGNAVALGHLVRQAGRVREGVEEALEEGLGVDYAAQLDEQPSPAGERTPWRSLARPFRILTPEIEVTRGIPYTEAGRRGHLDIYRRRGVDLDKAPVLLQVHGGAWTIGEKERQGVPLMAHLAAKGWVCVAINYRLAPRDAFPAQIVDVKRAIAWVKEHIEEYGGDPDYVAITGGSAGGHLASLAALTPGDATYQPGFEDADTSVRAAVPHYGVYDLAGATGLRSAIAMRDMFLAPRIMQKRWNDDPDLFENASPLLRITSDAPDFFVLHGTHDTLVSVEQARLFVARLREVSERSVVYAELPGAQHAYDVFSSVRCAHVVRGVDRFLHWHWNGYRNARGMAADRT